MKNRISHAATLAVGTLLGAFLGGWLMNVRDAHAAAQRVFEMRTYTAMEGKLPNLQARFRDHTIKLFEKHGMKNVGYWVPQDSPKSQNTLIYIISHENREQAKKNWAAFRADPVWQAAQKASEANGKLVA
ncbi:MAG: NIPSNAP family protein, partial [Bryobacteraceae bacterium]